MVLAIGIGFLVTLLIALAVMVAVALPNLRSGGALLTPTGDRATKQAAKQAKAKAGQMAEKVWRSAVALSRGIARAWQPISARLHEALDRLERPDPQPGDSQLVGPRPGDAQPEGPHPSDAQPDGPQPDGPQPDGAQPGDSQAVVPPPVRPVQDRFDVEAVIGRRVGRPRPMPAESGPIPQIPAGKPEASSSPKSDPETSVIDLRETMNTPEPARSARRAP